MHLAVINKDVQVVETLINAGFDTKSVNHQGNTPLHLAVINKDVQVVETLINVDLILNP